MRTVTTPDLVAAIRGRMGISQEELARRMDVSIASVNAWENGRSAPRRRHRDRLEQLATELGVRRRFDIVVVDRDPDAVQVTAELLRSVEPDARVHTATTSTEALVLCGANTPWMVLLDLDVPGPDARAVVAAMERAGGLDATVVVGVAGDDERASTEAARSAVAQVVRRPVHRAALVEALELLDRPESTEG